MTDDHTRCPRRVLEPMRFGYVNYRGEIGIRRVWPIGLWFGSTEYHREPQWLLKAIDLDKGEERDFAVAYIKGDGYLPDQAGDARAAPEHG